MVEELGFGSPGEGAVARHCEERSDEAIQGRPTPH
jgi:hypothetical protein